MAERSIAAVLKTVDCNRSGGSNPSLSARLETKISQNAVNINVYSVFCFSAVSKKNKIGHYLYVLFRVPFRKLQNGSIKIKETL